jgi:hypothetical protein
MENQTSSPPVSSDGAVSSTMRHGFEKMLLQSSAGLVLGGMAGVVLARGGGSSSARKVLAGLGAGVGLGSAWTRCSMDIEELLGTASK